tara:strand:- start:2615 stop:3190 length:576 start_codon:yes stop_codon:yes gene_type:complete
MATTELERFVQAIIDDHGLATGIKTLGSHYDLVAYANLRGFAITLAEWGRYVAMDSLQASDEATTLALRADPVHWSWAFRQISKWRGLLMDGAGSDGLLGAADFAVSSSGSLSENPEPLTDAQKDEALASFIASVRNQPELKQQVKAARNQDEVIALAAAQGFTIDSLTLLRSWSTVTDFSKPTWFGWFDD